MGEDPRAADERGLGDAGLRAGGGAPRRAAGDPGAPGWAHGFGPVTLDEPGLVHWGRRVGAEVGRPAWFALHGDLGAGKSVLARAIARGAGVTGLMPSPTFNLVFQYVDRNGALVWHLDLYRLTGEEGVVELGWWDLGADDEIVLVEWPERAASLHPADRWDIFIDDHPEDDLLRLVTAWPRGNPPPLPLPDASR